MNRAGAAESSRHVAAALGAPLVIRRHVAD